MPLTNTSQRSSLTTPLPTGLKFEFPTQPAPNSPQPSTRVSVSPRSTWSTDLHWHVTHTEYIKVLSGAALGTINGKSFILRAQDDPKEVPRYARHEWMRFDRPEELLTNEQRETQKRWMKEVRDKEVEKLREVDLVVDEWTDPADGEKEIFFRNMLSTFQEPGYQRGTGQLLMYLQVLVVMWEGDNFNVMLDCQGWKGGWRRVVEECISYAFMGFVALLGRMVGCRGVNEEYTPPYLVQSWKNRNGAGDAGRKEL
ncbi:hypothetical protein ACLMJK_009254 [Lecanora helva]